MGIEERKATSLLNQLFNRGVFGAKCKTCLNLAIARIKLLQNKRDLQAIHMRKEIAQFLQAGQEAIARIRVEHVIREQNVWAAYEILELFCEFILARIPVIENQRECPIELREAIASIMFAAPRCSDVPDLLHIKNLFTTKYGKEFALAVSELRPDSGVNRTIIEKLSVSAPSGEVKLKVLKEITREFNMDWDSSNAEAELTKRHEDLLGGPKEITSNGAQHVQTLRNQDAFTVSHNNGVSKQIKVPSSRTAEIQPSFRHDNNENSGSDTKTESGNKPCGDVMMRARTAIAYAERASAAARAAANLVNQNFDFQLR